jgi:hypothetical protein
MEALMKDSDAINTETTAFAFENESLMWQAGYELIMELRRLRGITTPITTPAPEMAERAIQNFCHRLRYSSSSLSLPKIQRQARLTNENVVIVVHVLLSHWAGTMSPAINQIAVVAYGFSPVVLQSLVDTITARLGIGRYVEAIDGFLHPTDALIALLRPVISATELIELREQLKSLPTAPEDRADIPDNGFFELE